MKKLTLLCVIGMLAVAAQAIALPFNETGDAGSTLPSAQLLPGETTVIYGSLNSDVDLFGFGWSGGSLVVDTAGTGWDTQLFLFNSAGQGVVANDDSGSLQSRLQVASLAAGDYYLGISHFDLDPVTATGDLMFQSSPYGGLYGPLDPTAVLDHWANTGSSGGDYIINLSPTSDNSPAPVPEPTPFVLLGAGLLGASWTRRKRDN